MKSDFNGAQTDQQSIESPNRREKPVILSSIHNDGMSLELKIKDAVKWKFEAFE